MEKGSFLVTFFFSFSPYPSTYDRVQLSSVFLLSAFSYLGLDGGRYMVSSLGLNSYVYLAQLNVMDGFKIAP
jgi:hypothetical protein